MAGAGACAGINVYGTYDASKPGVCIFVIPVGWKSGWIF